MSVKWRSVANNLNDIAKNNPDFVVQTAPSWFGQHKTTDALIKHACRTLLKQAQPEMMTLFGFEPDLILLTALEITTPTVAIGEQLSFNFSIESADF